MGNKSTQSLNVQSRTVAERLAFWRSLTWEELAEKMEPAGSGMSAEAAMLDAPPVAALLIRD